MGTSRRPAKGIAPAEVLWTWGTYLAFGLVAFFPLLFLGQSYFDGDLLNSNHIARQFLRDRLLQGHMPLWNPHLFGGQPFLADGDFMVCYPFLYPTLLFPVEYGFAVFYLTSFLIAALGMRFWLKGLGLSEASCRLGGLLLGFSGYFWSELVHPPEMAAFVWVPWWGGCLARLGRELSGRWAFAAGLSFAFLFTAGNFQLSLGVLYGGAAYFLFQLFSHPEGLRRPDLGGRVLRVVLFFGWGALPLLAFWIPAWEFMARCGRLLTPMDYATFQADYSLDPARLGQFFFPGPAFGPGDQQAPDHLANSSFLGPWSLFLMALAFRKGGDRKEAWFFAITGALALLLAFGRFFPLHLWACHWVPGIGLTRAPYRYIFLATTAMSLLMALGYERLRDGASRGKDGKAWLVRAALYAAILLLASRFSDGLVWPQVLGLAGGLLALIAMGWKSWREKAEGIFLLSLGATLLLSGWAVGGSRSGPSSNFDWTARCPLLARLPEKVGLARVFIGDNIAYPVRMKERTLRMPLPTDVAMVSGLRNVSGYNPLCLKTASDLYSLPARTHSRLMAVKAFVTGNEGQGLAGFDCSPLEGAAYCENREPVSFVYAPREVRSVMDDGERFRLMHEDDYNPYRTAFLSSPAEPFQSRTEAGLTYALKEAGSDQELFQVGLQREGWVVFSEVMYPGWKAWVDGQRTPLVTANHAFRALWMGPGEHRILFRYEPVWERPILFGLILWTLVTVFGLVVLRRSRSVRPGWIRPR